MVKYYDVNEPGHSIRCKIYCDQERGLQKVILCGHGFGGHKDNKAAERFANRVLSKFKNVGVITFNLPCHGDDVKKKLTLADCDTYITGILKDIRTRLGVEEIYLYATSFTGYLTFLYLHRHGNPFRKIVLRCPAIRMYDSITKRIISESEMEKLQKGKEAEVGFDRKIKISRAFLEELQASDITQWDYLDYADDILILHGTKDEVIPFAEVHDFCEEKLIECIPIEKADHRFQDPKIMDRAIGLATDFMQL